MKYRYNSLCSCARCRFHGMLGPIVLITVGVLFLLDQITHEYWLQFGKTSPIILIVIGLVLFLERGSSTMGHIPRGYVAAPTLAVQPGVPVTAPIPTGAPVVTPPPAAPSSNLPGEPYNPSDDQGVSHG